MIPAFLSLALSLSFFSSVLNLCNRSQHTRLTSLYVDGRLREDQYGSPTLERQTARTHHSIFTCSCNDIEIECFPRITMERNTVPPRKISFACQHSNWVQRHRRVCCFPFVGYSNHNHHEGKSVRESTASFGREPVPHLSAQSARR